MFACGLVNRYELPYYGVKDWDDEAAAREERESFLAARGVGDPVAWDVVELEEMKLKMANVKLRNDPAIRLFLDEGGAFRVVKRE